MRPKSYAIPVRSTMNYETVVMPNTYQFQPSRGYVRLQKLAFWFLRKIGAYASIRQESLSFQTFTPKKIFDAILESRYMNDFRHEPPKYVLIGQDVYKELMNEQIRTGEPIAFESQDIYGMKIILVPHMNGFVPLAESPADIFPVTSRHL
jgi:hypothetical protein